MKSWATLFLLVVLLPLQRGWSATCACNTDECWNKAKEVTDSNAGVPDLERQLAGLKEYTKSSEFHRLPDEDQASISNEIAEFPKKLADAKAESVKMWQDWKKAQKGNGLIMSDEGGQWQARGSYAQPPSPGEVCDDPSLGDNKKAYPDIFPKEDENKIDEGKKEGPSQTPDTPSRRETPAGGGRDQRSPPEKQKSPAPASTGVGKMTGKRFNDIPGREDSADAHTLLAKVMDAARMDGVVKRMDEDLTHATNKESGASPGAVESGALFKQKLPLEEVSKAAEGSVCLEPKNSLSKNSSENSKWLAIQLWMGYVRCLVGEGIEEWRKKF